MYGKKVAGIFLLLSFQAHGMLTINQLTKKMAPKKDQVLVYNVAKHRVASIENSQYNESFFTNSMVSDTQLNVMGNLDHRSNIQFIRTSKHLYDQYVKKASDGRITYRNCLFTTIPFDFDCYVGALFHYAPQHENQAKILLSIEGEAIKSAHSKILKKVEIKISNTQQVIDFYKQIFTDKQIRLLSYEHNFVKKMLKKGLSPNAKSSGGVLMHEAVFLGNKELLDILVSDHRANRAIEGNNGITASELAITLGKTELLEILLIGSRGDIYRKQECLLTAIRGRKTDIVKIILTHEEMIMGTEVSIFCWPAYIRLYKENPETAQLFFKHVSFAYKALSWTLSSICIMSELFFNT